MEMENNIKELLQNHNCTFKIKGHNSIGLDVFTIEHVGEYPNEQLTKVSNAYYTMNVNMFGATEFTLYTYDMFSNRTDARVKYSDIYDIEVIEELAY